VAADAKIISTWRNLKAAFLPERIEKKTVPKRLGRPEEGGQVVACPALEAALYITGAVIPVKGGIDLLALRRDPCGQWAKDSDMS